MMKLMFATIFVGITSCVSAFSQDLDSLHDTLPAEKIPLASEIVGIEMLGKGKIAKFVYFELTSGANEMLHGYTPHAGDVVEWYVRDTDCDLPDVSCKFDLGIRKKDQ